MSGVDASSQAETDLQRNVIKSQAKKVLDLLVKIAPIPSGAKEAYSVSKELSKALDMSSATFDTGILTASDPNMNCLAEIARRFSNELSKLSRNDENWWIETSGANFFSRSDSTEALKRLQQQRQYLLALKDASEGLKALATTLMVQSVANFKGIAKLYIPSIAAMDAMVTKETRDNFDVCMRLIDTILTKLDVAINATADMNKSIDRFLTLINTKDMRQLPKPTAH